MKKPLPLVGHKLICIKDALAIKNMVGSPKCITICTESFSTAGIARKSKQ
jgi:hypothetical protein